MSLLPEFACKTNEILAYTNSTDNMSVTGV